MFWEELSAARKLPDLPQLPLKFFTEALDYGIGLQFVGMKVFPYRIEQDQEIIQRKLTGQWHANNKKYWDKLEPFSYFSSRTSSGEKTANWQKSRACPQSWTDCSSGR